MKYIAALLLCLTSTAIAQTVDSTGNIVDPTKWTNVIPMNGTQLSQVEGAGGGPIPALNTDTNTIRFSFMPYTVSQIIAINSVLSGQGISVGGFNYSWKIYNDLENCCGTRGMLMGNVSLYNKGGNLLNSYNYDYSLTDTGADFKKFTGTETFNSPYQLNSLGDISVSWFGKDSNFWSGYYGPRVRDTEITLNYTVTAAPTPTPTIPTTTNVTTSDIIAEVTAPTTTTTTEPTTTQTVAQTTPVVETNTVTTTSPSTTSATTTQPVVAAVQTTREAAPVAQQTTQQTSQQTATQSSAEPSLTSVLSMIQSNQARENAIATTAVAQANQVAQQAVKEAEQTAVATAMASSSQSIEMSKDSVRSETRDTRTSTMNSGLPLVAATTSNITTMSANQSQSTSTLQAPSTSQQVLPGQQSASNVVNTIANITIQPVITASTASTQQQQNNTGIQQTTTTTATSRSDLFALLPPVPVVQEIATQQQTSLPVNNSMSAFVTETVSNTTSFFTNRADPLQDYVEKNSIMVAMAQPEVRPTTVRTNVQDSTLAGNVRVERLQVVPNGYNMYLSMILRDVAFYESKEIYKNNALKDNARTMYFIEKGNTDTFNKMIEAQYK